MPADVFPVRFNTVRTVSNWLLQSCTFRVCAATGMRVSLSLYVKGREERDSEGVLTVVACLRDFDQSRVLHAFILRSEC
jgi:hypothetical protein